MRHQRVRSVGSTANCLDKDPKGLACAEEWIRPTGATRSDPPGTFGPECSWVYSGAVLCGYNKILSGEARGEALGEALHWTRVHNNTACLTTRLDPLQIVSARIHIRNVDCIRAGTTGRLRAGVFVASAQSGVMLCGHNNNTASLTRVRVRVVGLSGLWGIIE